MGQTSKIKRAAMTLFFPLLVQLKIREWGVEMIVFVEMNKNIHVLLGLIYSLKVTICTRKDI